MGHTNTQKQRMPTQFRSTKGASKQRRDQINTEISKLRDNLPLPESARQRLSQLQVMSLTCCFIRKCNYFSRLFGNPGTYSETDLAFEFSQAMTGFLLITTREGKLLYISENVTEYLGHSMVDMMTQGDSLYDIIDKRDHQNVQSHLLQSNYTPSAGEERTFFCRMNVSRSFRRHAGFGDHKVMHIRGHFITAMLGGDHYGNQPVFMAICSPLVTPDVKETTMHHNTLMFQSVHGLDMSYIEIAPNAEFHLGYTDAEIKGKSWYSLLHPEDIHEAREKHIQLVKSSHEMGCMLTVRIQAASQNWVWVNMVMHIRQPFVCDNGDPAIVCSNYIISENEAPIFKVQSQYLSSHIVRSPECLGTPSGSSPPHTITQVPAEREGSLGGQEDTGVTFRADFGIIPTNPALGESSQGYSSSGVDIGGSHVSDGFLSDAGSDQSLSGSQLSMEIKPSRESILYRLKRKVKGEDQCRPLKQARMSTPDYHENGGGIAIQASAFITTAGPLMYEQELSSGGSSGMFVLGPMHGDAIYSNLKKEVDVMVAPEQPKINPNISATTLDLNQPLTPESISSDSHDMMPGTTNLSVDTTDSAVVPPSVLTPDSSPSSSPVYTKTELDVSMTEFSDDLSIFDNPHTPKVQSEERSTVSLEKQIMLEYLSNVDIATKTSQELISRSIKPHQNPQSRIAEIEAALKLEALAHQQKMHNQNLSSISGINSVTMSPPITQSAASNAKAVLPSSSIPVPVAAMEPSAPSPIATEAQQTLANDLTNALLKMVRSKGAENLSMADMADFMLVPDVGDNVRGTSDDTLLACLDALTDDDQNSPFSGDLLEYQQFEDFATNAPSHGDVEQLTEAVFKPAL